MVWQNIAQKKIEVFTLDYTVLMAVYAKEKAMWLQQSLDSIFVQTMVAREVILVCDGVLPDAIENVIDGFIQAYPDIFKTIRLKEQRGLAHALNEGMKHCRTEYIVRMDSDDISTPSRCEMLLHYMTKNNLEVCGSYVQEFIETPDQLMSVRQVPCTQTEIISYATKRNPFNHPSVAFCKTSIQKVGGYPIMAGFEDYLLWLTLIKNNVQMGNMPQILVYMRVSENFYQRRSGWVYLQQTAHFLKAAIKISALSRVRGGISLLQRATICFLPASWCKIIYNGVLRKKI